MNDPIYKIVGWDEHFENHKSRRNKKTAWVPIPNSFSGERISDLIDVGGAESYGAYVAMVLVASGCEERGTLLKKNGKPYTPRTLARLTGIDEDHFKQMIPIALSSTLISTSKEVDTARTLEGREVVSKSDTERKKERKKERKNPPPSGSDQTKKPNPNEQAALEIWNHYPKKTAKAKAIPFIVKAIKAIGKRDDVEDPAAWLLGVVKEYEAVVRSAGKSNLKYAKNPVVFFRDGRYDDDRETWKIGGDKPIYKFPEPQTNTDEETPPQVLRALELQKRNVK